LQVAPFFRNFFACARVRVRARVCFIFTLQPATIPRKPAPLLASSGFNLFSKAATLLQLLKHSRRSRGFAPRRREFRFSAEVIVSKGLRSLTW
jgi:hypothetical protein